MVKSTGGLGRGVRRSVVVVPRRPRGVRSVLVLRAIILFYLAVQSVAPQERVVFFLFHALGLQLLVACGHVPRRRFAFIFRLCTFECDNFAWHDDLFLGLGRFFLLCCFFGLGRYVIAERRGAGFIGPGGPGDGA